MLCGVCRTNQFQMATNYRAPLSAQTGVYRLLIHLYYLCFLNWNLLHSNSEFWIFYGFQWLLEPLGVASLILFSYTAQQQHSRFGSFMRISLFNEKSELNAFPIRSINIFEFACLEIIYSSIVPITKCDGIKFMCFAHDRLDQLHIKCIRHLSLNN